MDETSGPDWDAVRADYEAGEMAVRAIAAMHGVSIDLINRRRVKETWRPRRIWAYRGQRRILVGKLFHLLEKQIAQLEKKLEENGDFDMADTRVLETMTKTFEKLGELQDTVNNKEARKRAARLDPELEAVREKLIRRVEALETE